MIQATDLRVGNKVHYDTGESIEVHTIDWNDIKMAELNNRMFNINHKPIPITEDILLKCGFVRINSGWFRLGNLAINISFDTEWGGNWMGIRLKYLHELQNLYWCLCKKELDISL